MAVLIPLATFKDHLRVDDSTDDVRVERIGGAAIAAVVSYCKAVNEDGLKTGSPLTLPADIEAAILLVAENMYDRADQDPFSEAVRSLLMRHRDPALA